MSLPSVVLPGTSLGLTSSLVSGAGTYVEDSRVVAATKGKPSTAAPSASSTKAVLSVNSFASPLNAVPSRNVTRHNLLPFVSAIVLAKVTRLQQRQANVAILAVNDRVCADEFAGVVRREDVRGWEIDKVKVEDMFRVGDVVRAVVVSDRRILQKNNEESMRVARPTNQIFTCHQVIDIPWRSSVVLFKHSPKRSWCASCGQRRREPDVSCQLEGVSRSRYEQVRG